MKTLAATYTALLDAGEISPAPAQLAALPAFDVLLENLRARTPARGLYIYGAVGRGKSLLMNLFYELAPTPKKRVHFHAFMEDVHERFLHVEAGRDAMLQIAESLRAEAVLFCFDEFYITNIADAMLLGRLMQKLFEVGVCVVATSNWAPPDLFQGGVNRHQFKPFIKLIETQLTVLEIGGEKDWREENFAPENPRLPLYFVNNRPTFAKTAENYMTGDKRPAPHDIFAKQQHGSLIWFVFEELCGKPIGREGYLYIAQTFETVVLEKVIPMSANQADRAMRFITLVDICYEHKVRLIISAAARANMLVTDGAAAFPFQRTVSRLMEMQGWG